MVNDFVQVKLLAVVLVLVGEEVVPNSLRLVLEGEEVVVVAANPLANVLLHHKLLVGPKTTIVCSLMESRVLQEKEQQTQTMKNRWNLKSLKAMGEEWFRLSFRIQF